MQNQLSLNNSNGWALAYVPEDLKTAELCLAAVRDREEAIKYVPEDFIEQCLAALKDKLHIFSDKRE